MTPPKSVHVLFVHGVGQHSPLSALLRPYQAFRSNLRSPEAPTTVEDLIPNWRLEEFNEKAMAPYLKLTPKPGQPRPPDAVYFYEVNYSALAGVVRGDQPLDITSLFVGFDLALNVARQNIARTAPAGTAAIAQIAQRLAAVLVAATVPILGLPSLLLRNFTATFVANFSRFFEDVATFALDRNGDKLISAHVDRTVENIVNSERFDLGASELVIAAHSLGSIVIHNYLLRHWCGSDMRVVPGRLLTFGAPIGIICWTWLFLDYRGGPIDLSKETGRNYFSWDPQPEAGSPVRKVLWMNIVNYMDPIATAFPMEYVDLAQPPGTTLPGLEGGRVEHRYIKTGSALSAGSAHTDYLNDRPGFLEILGRLAYLRANDPKETATGRLAAEHWKSMCRALWGLRVGLWLFGVACLGGYFWMIARQVHEPIAVLLKPFSVLQPLAVLMLLLYLAPRAMVELLAFFQRLQYGGPTKRTAANTVRTLPWLDWASIPYRMRRFLGLGLKNVDPMAPAPPRILRALGRILSFIPTAVVMVIPIGLAGKLRGNGPGIFDLITNHSSSALLMLGLFLLYVIAFALSECFAQWRALVIALTSPAPGRS